MHVRKQVSINQFAHMDAQERELTPEEAQKLEAMTEEYEGYQEQGFDEESEDDPEIAARMRGYLHNPPYAPT